MDEHFDSKIAPNPTTAGRRRPGKMRNRRGHIVAITPGSPADKAGISLEDRIVAIDGKPVTQRRLTDWRAAFREGRVGTRMTFTLERNATRREAQVILEELLP